MPMQDIKFKSNSGQFNIDEAQGIVECFVAGIGNKDSVGDIVVTGAFAKSLMRRKPRVVWGHNWNDPIGKVLEIYEVPPNDPRLPSKMKTAGIGGLYAKVQFNLNSEKGREAFANVAFFGEEQEWSIGYKTLDAIYDNGKQANILREVELYELSPVLHGANQLTGTISVKSEEKGHGMPSMGMIVLEEKPKQPADPFLQGVAQPLEGDRLVALQNELTTRTGGPVKILKATESSVTFMKLGKGLFRLGYYFDGEQYMFGKPEKLGMPMMIHKPMMGMPNSGRPTMGPKPMPRIPNFPGVMQKPHTSEGPIVPVKYGDSEIQSGFFDSMKSDESLESIFQNKIKAAEQEDIAHQLLEITSSLQEILGGDSQVADAWVIPCTPENAFATKQALDPVLDYHRIESYVTEEGIVLASPMDYEAYEAIENATKSLVGRIGRGLTPGGGGKVRRGRAALARIEGVLDPMKRRDVDGDGLIFDGTWREMPDPTGFASRTDMPNIPGGFNPDPEDVKPPVPKATDKPKKNTIISTEPWYIRAAKEGRNIVPFIIPRKTKPKIERMFKDFLDGEGSSLPENHIVRRVSEAISKSKRYTELIQEVNEFGALTGFTRPKQTQDFLPDIDETMLEELRAVWPDVKDGLSKTGQHKRNEAGKMEKGRTPFEILNEVVEKGEFSRVNKQTQGTLTREQGEARDAALDREESPIGRLTRRGERIRKRRTEREKGTQRLQRGVDTRAGKARADRGVKREQKWPSDLPNPPFEIRTSWSGKGDYRKFDLSYEKIIDGKRVDLLEPYIKAGIFPENWREMDGEQQFNWFVANQEKLEKLTPSVKWQRSLSRLNDILLEEDMKIQEERERLARRAERATAPISKPKTPDAPNPVTAPKPKPSTTSTKPRTTDKTRRAVGAWVETVGEGAQMDGVEEDFGNTAMDIADRVFAAAYPDDEELPKPENFENAMDELDRGLGELGEIGDERQLSKRERALLNFMYQVRESLEEGQGRSRDSEQELGADEVQSAGGGGFSTEAEAELARRARAAERYGLGDDDDDISAGADIGEIYGGTDTDINDDFSETELNSTYGLSSSTAKARRFQKSNRRKKQGRGLSSSTDKAPRTEITNESTWWKKIGESLPREIRSSDSDAVKKGLTILQQKISKYDAGAFTPGSKRTNVGSIKITADEADKILDAVMAVIDRQKTAGKDGGVGSRGEIFAELLEKIASAAMSTFVDKTSSPADR